MLPFLLTRFLYLKIYLYVTFVCTRVCLYEFVLHMHVGVHKGQNKSLDLLELELQAVLSYCVGAGNRVQVLSKSSLCS